MTQEDTLEGLFAQFDEVAEETDSPPTIAVGSTNLTRSRAPSLGTRLSRWVLQGAGLVVLYLAAFLLLVANPQELLVDSLGLVVIAGLTAPLLGTRPLAHPLRWLLLLPLLSALAAGVATLTRWPALLGEWLFVPLSSLVLAACGVAEAATAPSTIVSCLAVGFFLMWSARQLARANPWIETRSGWRPWRRVLGLSTVGLLAGMLATLPLLYHMTWNQAWVVNSPDAVQASTPLVFSAPGDLASVMLNGPVPEELRAVPLVSRFNRQDLIARLPACTAYLESMKPLTVADLPLMRALLSRCQSEAPHPEIDRLIWAAYPRGHRNELDLEAGWLTTRLLHRVLLHKLCAAETTPELLQLWQDRADFLETLIPASQNRDDIFFERLRNYRPGSYNPVVFSSRYQRPLRLFGLETPWTPAALSLQAERTLAVLVWGRYRHDAESQALPARQLVPDSYRPRWFFDRPLAYLLGPSSDHLTRYGTSEDVALIRAICQLKKVKAETGLYPAQIELDSDRLSYKSDGLTALLTTAKTLRGSDEYFEETLR